VPPIPHVNRIYPQDLFNRHWQLQIRFGAHACIWLPSFDDHVRRVSDINGLLRNMSDRNSFWRRPRLVNAATNHTNLQCG